MTHNRTQFFCLVSATISLTSISQLIMAVNNLQSSAVFRYQGCKSLKWRNKIFGCWTIQMECDVTRLSNMANGVHRRMSIMEINIYNRWYKAFVVPFPSVICLIGNEKMQLGHHHTNQKHDGELIQPANGYFLEGSQWSEVEHLMAMILQYYWKGRKEIDLQIENLKAVRYGPCR